MSKTLTVAFRDFKHTVWTKGFLLAVVGVPIMLVVIGVIAAIILMNHREPPLKGTIAIIDPAGEIAREISAAMQEAHDEEASPASVMEALQSAGESREQSSSALSVMAMGASPDSLPSFGSIEVDVEIEHLTEATDTIPETVKQRIQDGELIAAALFQPGLTRVDHADSDDSTKQPYEYELLIAKEMDSDHLNLIERTFGDAIVRVRFAQANQDLQHTRRLLAAPRARANRLTETGDTIEEKDTVRALRQFVPMIFMMLLCGDLYHR